jgi:hypothetical protein
MPPFAAPSDTAAISLTGGRKEHAMSRSSYALWAMHDRLLRDRSPLTRPELADLTAAVRMEMTRESTDSSADVSRRG